MSACSKIADDIEHRLVLRRQRDHPRATSLCGELRAAVQQHVVSLGRTRGEDDIGRTGADQRRDCATRISDRAGCCLTIGMF